MSYVNIDETIVNRKSNTTPSYVCDVFCFFFVVGTRLNEVYKHLLAIINDNIYIGKRCTFVLSSGNHIYYF